MNASQICCSCLDTEWTFKSQKKICFIWLSFLFLKWCILFYCLKGTDIIATVTKYRVVIFLMGLAVIVQFVCLENIIPTINFVKKKNSPLELLYYTEMLFNI